ncbi:MAG TPA: hypothetical protein VMR21_07485 [Vicinamibacteria bacterium]|nr:hypothetical protein [Vicinamibacteria bacterium]
MSLSCPRCARPVAAGGPRCLYCGAELPAEAVEAAAAARAALEAQWADPHPPGPTASPSPGATRTSGRVLLVLPLCGVDAEASGRALGLSRSEGGQLVVRGGPHLHRILPPPEAQAEAARLRAAGLEVLEVPEDEVRGAEPLVARRGRPDGDFLLLGTEEGEVPVAGAEVVFVVLGPITRNYATTAGELRRLSLATLEPGYRVHLHRREHPRPVELDPADFDFGPGGASGGAQRQILAWVDRFFPAAPRDDSFRLAIPALAPAAPGEGLDAMAAHRPGARPIFDNLAQFRFHSAWRATARRRLGR